jgi:DNA replication protein DnaC
MHEPIHQLLETLHFQGMAAKLDDIMAKAEREGAAIHNVLLQLLQEEYRHRQEKSMAYRIQKATLPWPWTLDSFPFDQQPGVNKTQILGIADLSFLERRENIVLIGAPGTGKSGIAIGLLRQALINGHRGRFYNAQHLLDELYTTLADRRTLRFLNQLSRYAVLVIDELGYLTLNDEQSNAFFKLMDMRYNRCSTIITTNLDYPDWYALFKQKSLVDALLDRLRHRCITLHIDGPSLRTPTAEDAD